MPRLVVSALILLLLAGCGRTWRVRVPVPRTAFDDRHALVLGELTGAPLHVVQLRELAGEVLAGTERWRLRAAVATADAPLVLDLAVVRWELLPERRVLWRDRLVHDAGPSRTERERVLVREARAELLVRVREADGRELLPPVTVRGRACGGPRLPDLPAGPLDGFRDPALDEAVVVLRGPLSSLVNHAMAEALAGVLDLLAGKRPVVWLALDGGDPAQEEALRLAGAGRLAEARAALSAYRRLCPASASAAFNLARVEEAAGEVERALDLYAEACGLADDNRDYRQALEACRLKADALRGAPAKDWL